MMRLFQFTCMVCIAFFVFSAPLSAASYDDPDLIGGANAPSIPPSLDDLRNLPVGDAALDETGMPFDIRLEALREAAVSYGARGGLAYRTYEIRGELEQRSTYMDKIFDFRQLLIPAPSGFMIEPPIISESINAMLIDNGGQEAAVSDKIYNIISNAKISSAPRNWRIYLEREWGDVDPPPEILRPRDEAEQMIWDGLLTKGWEQGVLQANEIFEEDLNRLTSDFRGMVRYRTLLAQGMVSPPYALHVDRGVTGGGDEMRVGDRAVQITGVPELITGTSQWRPANR